MADDDYIAFAQFCLDRFLGHKIAEDLMSFALSDWRKDASQVSTNTQD